MTRIFSVSSVFPLFRWYCRRPFCSRSLPLSNFLSFRPWSHYFGLFVCRFDKSFIFYFVFSKTSKQSQFLVGCLFCPDGFTDKAVTWDFGTFWSSVTTVFNCACSVPCQNFIQKLRLVLYYMYASSDGTGETAQSRLSPWCSHMQ